MSRHVGSLPPHGTTKESQYQFPHVRAEEERHLSVIVKGIIEKIESVLALDLESGTVV